MAKKKTSTQAQSKAKPAAKSRETSQTRSKSQTGAKSKESGKAKENMEIETRRTRANASQPPARAAQKNSKQVVNAKSAAIAKNSKSTAPARGTKSKQSNVRKPATKAKGKNAKASGSDEEDDEDEEEEEGDEENEEDEGDEEDEDEGEEDEDDDEEGEDEDEEDEEEEEEEEETTNQKTRGKTRGSQKPDTKRTSARGKGQDKESAKPKPQQNAKTKPATNLKKRTRADVKAEPEESEEEVPQKGGRTVRTRGGAVNVKSEPKETATRTSARSTRGTAPATGKNAQKATAVQTKAKATQKAQPKGKTQAKGQSVKDRKKAKTDRKAKEAEEEEDDEEEEEEGEEEEEENEEGNEEDEEEDEEGEEESSFLQDADLEKAIMDAVKTLKKRSLEDKVIDYLRKNHSKIGEIVVKATVQELMHAGKISEEKGVLKLEKEGDKKGEKKEATQKTRGRQPKDDEEGKTDDKNKPQAKASEVIPIESESSVPKDNEKDQKGKKVPQSKRKSKETKAKQEKSGEEEDEEVDDQAATAQKSQKGKGRAQAATSEKKNQKGAEKTDTATKEKGKASKSGKKKIEDSAPKNISKEIEIIEKELEDLAKTVEETINKEAAEAEEEAKKEEVMRTPERKIMLAKSDTITSLPLSDKDKGEQGAQPESVSKKGSMEKQKSGSSSKKDQLASKSKEKITMESEEAEGSQTIEKGEQTDKKKKALSTGKSGSKEKMQIESEAEPPQGTAEKPKETPSESKGQSKEDEKDKNLEKEKTPEKPKAESAKASENKKNQMEEEKFPLDKLSSPPELVIEGKIDLATGQVQTENVALTHKEVLKSSESKEVITGLPGVAADQELPKKPSSERLSHESDIDDRSQIARQGTTLSQASDRYFTRPTGLVSSTDMMIDESSRTANPDESMQVEENHKKDVNGSENREATHDTEDNKLLSDEYEPDKIKKVKGSQESKSSQIKDAGDQFLSEGQDDSNNPNSYSKFFN